MFCVLICYVMPGCFALSCPKNAQSDPVLFCASDNKILPAPPRGCGLGLSHDTSNTGGLLDYNVNKE